MLVGRERALIVFALGACGVSYPTEERFASHLVEQKIAGGCRGQAKRDGNRRERAGKPDGQDQEFYYQAERELTETAAPDQLNQMTEAE